MVCAWWCDLRVELLIDCVYSGFACVACGACRRMCVCYVNVCGVWLFVVAGLLLFVVLVSGLACSVCGCLLIDCVGWCLLFVWFS